MVHKLTNQRIAEIVARDMPGHIVDTTPIKRHSGSTDVAKDAPNIEYLRKKFLGKAASVTGASSVVLMDSASATAHSSKIVCVQPAGKVAVVSSKTGEVVAEQG